MHKNDEAPKAPDKPYAVDEVDFPTLGKAVLLLIVFTIFSTALASGAYWLFVVHEKVPAAQVLEATPIPPDPNVPILQRDPVAEIHKFRADEYDAERSYSHWQDGDNKTSLRIPVSRALEIVKANGLPKAVKLEVGSAAKSGAVGSSAPATGAGASAISNTSLQSIPPLGPRP